MRTMALLALNRSRRRQRTGHDRDLAHLSDEALVALVARGDEERSAELYDRVRRIAYGLALRVLRDERTRRTPCRRRSSGLAERGDASAPSARRRAPGSSRSSTGAPSTSCAARSAAGRAARRTQPEPRGAGATGGGGLAALRARRACRTALKQPTRRPAGGARARLLRRLLAVRARRPARRAPGHHQRAECSRGLAACASSSTKHGHEEGPWNEPEFTS